MANTKEAVKRAAYSYEEVAAMVGKKRTWTYRQVAKGRLKPITGYGAAMIPAAEVERMLNPEAAAGARGGE